MSTTEGPTRPLAVGDWRITPVRDAVGPFLDAATVFAAVPPDERDALLARHGDDFTNPGRTHLNIAVQGYVLRRPGRTIIVDTCVGGSKPDRQPPVPGFVSRWPQTLARAGVASAEVDTVVTTHLHHDHVGWHTTLGADGQLRPTFPAARYLLGRTEYDFLSGPAGRAMRDRLGDYRADSVLPIAAAGQLDLVDGDHQIDAGVSYRPAAGHTPGHRIIEVTVDGHTAMLVGDLVHHPLQIERPEISTAMCVAADEAAVTRREVLDRAARADAVVFANHLPYPVRVRHRAGGFDYEVDTSILSYGP
jgi:glyoxylase-like metal-dependent hydrolase (beta-lactamase superfamily II)